MITTTPAVCAYGVFDSSIIMLCDCVYARVYKNLVIGDALDNLWFRQSHDNSVASLYLRKQCVTLQLYSLLFKLLPFGKRIRQTRINKLKK